MAVMNDDGAASVLWDVWGGPPALFLPRVTRSAASGWSAPVDLETTPATHQSFSLKLTGQGASQVVIWSTLGPGNSALRSSSFASNWSAPIDLPSDRVAGPIALATNRAGLSMAAWVEETNAGRLRLVASTLAGIGPWSAPVVIDPDVVLADGFEVAPALALDEQGASAVLWVRALPGAAQGSPGRVFSASKPAGSVSWSAGTPVDLGLGASHQPRIVTIGPNRFVAAWEQTIDGRRSILGTHFTALRWEHPALLENDDRGDAGAIALAGNQAGTALVAWTQSTGDNSYTVWSTRFAAGTWSSAGAPIVPQVSGTVRGQPNVAMDSAGNGIASWGNYSLNGGHGFVEYSHLQAGASRWTTPVALSDQDVAGDVPALSMNSDGAAVIAWCSRVANNISVRSRLLRP
jgi:hypothetical protein